MPRKRRPVEDRFWEKVHKTDTCWLWTAAPTAYGYGSLGVFTDAMRPVAAHRVSWLIHFGPIPDGLFVLHRCDVRLCVNPAHLFLGTHVDNMHDMSAKGRHREQRVTHCPKGHEYTTANTRIRRNGSRTCRVCHSERESTRGRARRAQRKASTVA